jgi:putative nucleotidyltransferase with HDIG domain
MNGLVHRLGQGLRALTARPSPLELEAARAALTPACFDLFLQLPDDDQAHSLRVFHALARGGVQDPDLLAAGLLHDVGKIRSPLHLPGRIGVVLAQRWLPQAFRRWSAGEPRGWKRSFVVAARHPKWGAEMVRRAGGSERLAALVERHDRALLAAPEDNLRGPLLALYAADSRN